MARAHYFNNVFTYEGVSVHIVPNARVAIYDNETLDPILDTIYDSETGSGTKSNPFDAAADGSVEFWLTSSRYVRIVFTSPANPDVGDITLDFQYVAPAPGDIVNRAVMNAVYVDDPEFTGGVVINTGVNNARSAIMAAIATGKIVCLGPGTYLADNIIFNDNTILVGCGPSTILKRPNDPGVVDNFKTVIYMYQKSGTQVDNMIIDGNYANNNNDAHATLAPEIYTGGTRQILSRLTIRYFNYGAVDISGEGLVIDNVFVYGPRLNTYKAMYWTGFPSGSKDMGGFYGFVNGGGDYANNVFINNCYFEYLRTSSIYAGGTRLNINNISMIECHRGESFNQVTITVGTFGGAPGNGGGQLAPGAPTVEIDGITPQLAYKINISNVHIGPSSGAVASGLELDSQTEINVSNMIIEGCRAWGVHLNAVARANFDNIIINTCGVAFQAHDSLDIDINKIQLYNNTPVVGSAAIVLEGTSDYIRISGARFRGNVRNWLNTMTGTHLDVIAPQVVDGTDVPHIYSHALDNLRVLGSHASDFAAIINNFNDNGYGLQVLAGTTAGHYIAQFADKNGNISQYVTAGTRNLTVFSTNDTSSSVRALIGFAEQLSSKYFMGFDTDDSPLIIDVDGASPLLRIAKTSGLLSGPGLAFTPLNSLVLTQSGVVTSTKNAGYHMLGKKCFAKGSITVTSSTGPVANNAIILSGVSGITPVNVVAGQMIGTFQLTGFATFISGVVIYIGANDWRFAQDGSNNYVGINPANALVNGNVLSFSTEFEVA